MWRRWGDEFIVYNVASGQTHYLNALAAQVLQYFQGQAATFDELVQDVRDSVPEGEDACILERVRELLKGLDYLGLIAPVNP